MSSYLYNLLVLALFCQVFDIASAEHGEKRKLMRTEKGKHQQAVAEQDSGNVVLELGSSGGLMHSADASRKDAQLQTVEVQDLASSGERQSQEDGTEDRTKGVHSDAFTRAHDALANELKQKEAALRDWLSSNCITSKERQLNNKKKELSDYQGANANAWWKSAWSWIKRTYQNLFNDTENRLKREVASLQAQLNAMKAQKAAHERQVSDMQARKSSHHRDANALLHGLNNQVAALGTDLANLQSDKTAAQTTHNDLKENMIAEHSSAAAVFTKLIQNLDTAITEKRDVFYSVSATCAQYEKEGKNECKKCTGDERACGDTCISKSAQCSLNPGCACDDTTGHDLHQEFSETKAALEDTIKYHEAEINTHNDLLEQNQKDIEKIQADMEDADKGFDIEAQRIDALKTQLQKGKSTAEQAKQDATNALSQATEENEAAVTQLASDLRAAIEALLASQQEEKASKSALLIAQEATMKEFLETAAATIAGWDAKIQEAQTEKATMSSEASDLSAAIASATGSATPPGTSPPTPPSTPSPTPVPDTTSPPAWISMGGHCQGYGGYKRYGTCAGDDKCDESDPRNDFTYTCSTGSSYATYNDPTLTSAQKTQAAAAWPGKPASYYACVQGCAGTCSSTGARGSLASTVAPITTLEACKSKCLSTSTCSAIAWGQPNWRSDTGEQCVIYTDGCTDSGSGTDTWGLTYYKKNAA